MKPSAGAVCRLRPKFILRQLVVLATILPVLTGYAAASSPSDFSAICDRAAHAAAKKTGVPFAVLMAISLTETGRKRNGQFRPWPWTVNMEGKGVWFDDAAKAQSYVDKEFRRGARSFDVGCFQLNYKWHGQAFESVEHMFDPEANATYAANFLKSLYAEKGNWPEAAGAYHSRTPKYANKYTARFRRILASTGDAPPPPPPQPDDPLPQAATLNTAPVRVNRFPLLQLTNGGTSGMGSLFPSGAGAGAARLLGDG